MFKINTMLGAFVVIASFAPATAFAQSAAECEAGITEVNDMIASKTAASTGGDNTSLDEARGMSQQAQSAHDGGDYARCLELVNDAKAALDS